MAKPAAAAFRAAGIVFALIPIPALLPAATLYTNRAAWDSASSNRSDINFDSSEGFYSTPAGLTVSGVNFVGWQNSAGCYVAGCNQAKQRYVLGVWPFQGSLALYGPEDGVAGGQFGTTWGSEGMLTVNLPSGTTSVGADITFRGNHKGGIAFEDGGASRLYLYADGGVLIGSFWTETGFVGFNSAVPIASVVLAGTPDPRGSWLNNSPVLDNFAFGHSANDATAAPEPASVATGLFGLAWLAGIGFRRQAHRGSP